MQICLKKVFPEHISVEAEHIASLEGLSSMQPESWKANASLAASLMDFEKRLKTMGGEIKNPLNPENFISCFINALAEAQIDIHTKILVLRTFESHLHTRLERYTRHINKLLADQGVLPDLDTAPSDVTITMNAIVEGEDIEAALSAAVKTLDNGLAELQAEIYENLEERLSPEEASKWVDVPAKDLLADMQASNLIPSKLDNNETLESEKINLVKKLFDFILQDRSIPLVARAVLSEMQVTYTRIALQQADFLQDNQTSSEETSR